MTKTAITELVFREPFRPFAVRLNNNQEYVFATRRDAGASRGGKMLFWFGPEDQVVRIDAESIAEVFER